MGLSVIHAEDRDGDYQPREQLEHGKRGEDMTSDCEPEGVSKTQSGRSDGHFDASRRHGE